jgi:uncharacterized protein YfiM (DUF2279 family)
MRIVLVLLALICTASAGFAGDSGRGGIPEAISQDAFNRYITGLGLKLSVRHYLDTLPINQISDPVDSDVKATFEKMVRGNALQKDIDTQGNYVAGLENCNFNQQGANPESTNIKVRAWTQTGRNGEFNVGGKICFDVNGLVQDFKGISLEEAAVRLAALAYHEHTHHFQFATDDAAAIKKQEAEANGIGGYIFRTARLSQIPVLEWSSNPRSCIDSYQRVVSLLTSQQVTRTSRDKFNSYTRDALVGSGAGAGMASLLFIFEKYVNNPMMHNGSIGGGSVVGVASAGAFFGGIAGIVIAGYQNDDFKQAQVVLEKRKESYQNAMDLLVAAKNGSINRATQDLMDYYSGRNDGTSLSQVQQILNARNAKFSFCDKAHLATYEEIRDSVEAMVP